MVLIGLTNCSPPKLLERASQYGRSVAQHVGEQLQGEKDQYQDEIEKVVDRGRRKGASELVGAREVAHRNQRVGDAGAHVGPQDDGDGPLNIQGPPGYQSHRHGGNRRGALHHAGGQNSDKQAQKRIGGGGQQLLGESTAEKLEGLPHQGDAQKEQVEQHHQQQHSQDRLAEKWLKGDGSSSTRPWGQGRHRPGASRLTRPPRAHGPGVKRDAGAYSSTLNSANRPPLKRTRQRPPAPPGLRLNSYT